MRKIWLVDDDADESLLVRRALRDANSPVIVETFTSADGAMRELQSLRLEWPDLIICDLKMPGVSGLDFLDWLRKSPCSVIPVAIRSNSSWPIDVNVAYEHGANCYFQKGEDLEDMRQNFIALLQFWNRMCIPEIHQRMTG